MGTTTTNSQTSESTNALAAAIQEEATVNMVNGDPLSPEYLPELLGDTVTTFEHDHERTVYLASSLPVLAGCMPNVRGTYKGGRIYRPHHFLCAIATAASGKSTIHWARRLGDAVDAHIRATTPMPVGDDDPAAARYRGLFLPANASKAAFLQAFAANEGRGVMIDDEIDTLNSVLGQDWGNFSEMLRKAAEHEPINALRFDYDVQVQDPALSVVLAGTPNQARQLFQSPENGLYSRFSILRFSAPRSWMNGAPSDKAKDREDNFAKAAGRVKTLYDTLASREVPLEFELTDSHWSMLDRVFGQRLQQLVAAGHEPILDACVKRAGGTAFRVAMVLAVLRAHDEGDGVANRDHLTPADPDLAAGLALSQTYLKHSLEFAFELPRAVRAPSDSRGVVYHDFFRALPEEFKRSEALKVGDDVDISGATVDRYLALLVKRGLLTKVRHGHYAKATGSIDLDDVNGQEVGAKADNPDKAE